MTRDDATREAQRLADATLETMLVVDEDVHAKPGAVLPSYGFCSLAEKPTRYPLGRVVDIIHPGDRAGPRN